MIIGYSRPYVKAWKARIKSMTYEQLQDALAQTRTAMPLVKEKKSKNTLQVLEKILLKRISRIQKKESLWYK